MRKWIAAIASGSLVVGLVSCSSSSGGERGNGFGNGAGNGTGAGAMPGAGGGFGNPGTGGGVNLGGNGGTGGGVVRDGGECAAVKETTENTLAPVDIIWAIDNSGSMTLEAQGVQDNMNLFANGILNSGIDVHVVVISVDGPPQAIIPGLIGVNGVCIPPPLGSGNPCPGGGDSNPPIYMHVSDEVDSHNALEKIIQHYPTYKPILRQDAVKYFAVVTDDEANLDAATFTQQLNALDPGFITTWKFFGVFCVGGCPVLGACANTGNTYNQLVQQTGGLAGDLCAGQNGFQPVFNQLSQSVVTGAELRCEWDIPPPPPGETFNQNQVNVQYTPGGGAPEQFGFAGDATGCGVQDGWYYDDANAPTRVIACPETCTRIKGDLSGTVDVLFGCDTVQIPR